MLNDSNLILSSNLLVIEYDIYRRQKILFVLIDILFTIHLTILIAFLHFYTIDSSTNEILKFYYPFIWIILSIIYDIFGLIVVYQCYQIGLRVFVWIGTILLIFHCCAFAIILFLPIHRKIRSLNNNQNNFYTSRYVIFVIFWIFISILLWISVRLAFKLSKSLINIRYEVKESIFDI